MSEKQLPSTKKKRKRNIICVFYWSCWKKVIDSRLEWKLFPFTYICAFKSFLNLNCCFILWSSISSIKCNVERQWQCSFSWTEICQFLFFIIQTYYFCGFNVWIVTGEEITNEPYEYQNDKSPKCALEVVVT